jgi:hypothetical protein
MSVERKSDNHEIGIDRALCPRQRAPRTLSRQPAALRLFLGAGRPTMMGGLPFAENNQASRISSKSSGPRELVGR